MDGEVYNANSLEHDPAVGNALFRFLTNVLRICRTRPRFLRVMLLTSPTATTPQDNTTYHAFLLKYAPFTSFSAPVTRQQMNVSSSKFISLTKVS